MTKIFLTLATLTLLSQNAFSSPTWESNFWHHKVLKDYKQHNEESAPLSSDLRMSVDFENESSIVFKDLGTNFEYSCGTINDCQMTSEDKTNDAFNAEYVNSPALKKGFALYRNITNSQALFQAIVNGVNAEIATDRNVGVYGLSVSGPHTITVVFALHRGEQNVSTFDVSITIADAQSGAEVSSESVNLRLATASPTSIIKEVYRVVQLSVYNQMQSESANFCADHVKDVEPPHYCLEVQ